MPSESTAIQARTVLKQDTEPDNTDALWLDTTTDPATLKRYDSGAASWSSVSVTEHSGLSGVLPSQHLIRSGDASVQANENNGGNVSLSFTDATLITAYAYTSSDEFTGATLTFEDGGTLDYPLGRNGVGYPSEVIFPPAEGVSSVEVTTNGGTEVQQIIAVTA